MFIQGATFIPDSRVGQENSSFAVHLLEFYQYFSEAAKWGDRLSIGTCCMHN